MSQRSLSDHAGFRHTKYFNSDLRFSTPKLSTNQGYLMDGVLHSPTNPKQGESSLKTIVLPTSLTSIRLREWMRDAFFHERWERRRIQLFLCAQFHRGLYKQILWTFSILSSVINLIPQLWRRWTYILETYSSPGERCTFFLLSHAHVIGYSRLSGRLGRCCVEMHYGTVSEDAITSFIGYYKVARANWSERVPCTSPTMPKIYNPQL